MTFISYAQNFEDVMLWRALKHVKKGFYIDVGAWSPDFDSVTRGVYEHGWRGINIEPNSEFNRQLVERRPHDKNLLVAMGDQVSVMTMNFLENPGLSTLDDTIALQHQKDGWNLDRQKVQVTTLAHIWKQHVSADQEVHFLKIDVEGYEEATLRGNDWNINRAWVVVIEATLPMSQVESYKTWEPILLKADYVFAYADGLNRFYVAKEHSELLSTFKYPPNVFDDFVLHNQQIAEAKAKQAETKATQAEAKATQAEAKATQAEATTAQQLHAVYHSTSWRLTAPLRWPIHQSHLLRKHGFKARVKALIKKTLIRAMHFVRTRPLLKLLVLKLLNLVPGIKTSIIKINHHSQTIRSESQLTAREREIYRKLKQAIKGNRCV